MSRNANSRFALNPTNIDISRSKFDRSSGYKTTFNVGQLVPFFCDEVLPGDTYQIRTSKLVRMQPLVTAPMDNLYLDTYYFFVPNRLVWEHWKQFNGENTESAWIPKTEYAIPQIKSPSGGWQVGTIADYFGLPTGISNISVSALPFRAYAMIVNEWFRDENLQQPLNINVDDATVTGTNGNDYVIDTQLGGKPFIAAKYHDYFTSCLPSPQKGPDVLINAVEDNYANVVTLSQTFDVKNSPGMTYGIRNKSSNSISLSRGDDFNIWGHNASSTTLNINSSKVGLVNTSPAFSIGSAGGTVDNNVDLMPNNLYADLGSTTSQATTINQLRMAFQIQKLYEKDARGGTRYTEILKSHFGVTSPDSRLQRPEYLGGNRIPVNINQVVQTSSTDATSPQANVAGISLTQDSHGDFIQSFTEHGYVIGLMVARYDHTYQQGIARHWSRKTRFDYYWPVLANIGEQAILNKEIYAQGTAVDEEVFGYQEAWADYRYKPSIVTAEMRSSYAQSLDSWHFADDYSQLPALGSSWIQEDASNIDRCLAVQSSVSAQLFADLFIDCECTRPMPVYSVPGLIDHH